MPIIKNEELEGKIKELHEKYGLEFYVTDNLNTANKWINQIKDNVNNSIAVDIETSGLKFYKDELLGIGLGISTKKAVYINTRNWSNEKIIKLLNTIKSIPNKKIYHNMFFDCKFLLGKFGVELFGEYDTYTYAHALHTDMQYYDESLGLKNLTVKFLPFGDYEEELIEFKKDYCKVNKCKVRDFKYSYIPDSILAPYACLDVICTLHLFNIFEKKVRNFEQTNWRKIRNVINLKHEANKLYIKASAKGLKVNKDKILEIHNELSAEQKQVVDKILKNENVKRAEKIIKRNSLIKMQEKRKTKAPLSRCRKEWNKNTFNISSNAHKTVLFFEVMGLKPIDKTASGAPSVDVSTISHFAGKGIEIMELIDRYNKINKILTSFLNVDKGKENGKGLWGLVSEESRIHPNYNINGTISSRLSTTEPNVAQYPSKGLAKVVKKCIEVEEGYKFISFDFKSFEVAILGFIADEPKIKEMLKNSYDPHSYTAYNVFKNEMELESSDMHDIMEEIKNKYNKSYRFRSKSINFLIPYDGSATGLSKSINSSKKEAQNMLDNYMNTNTKVRDFMKNNKIFANKNGYVENYFGARMYYRNTKKYNPFKPNFKKNYTAIKEYRTTTNFKIQSFNSFYLYSRLITFFKEVEQLGLDIQLMFTIYDSLMIRVNENVSDDLVVKILRKHFETVMNGVPFGIDVSKSPDDKRDWYSYEDIELYTTDNEELLDKYKNKC